MSQEQARFTEDRIDDFLDFLRAMFEPSDTEPPEHWLRRDVQLRDHRGSIKMTVQKTAIREEGLDPVSMDDGMELPAVPSYYDPTTGFLHVDLNPEPVDSSEEV